MHTLKIAVIDERGRRGSVEHSFRASLTRSVSCERQIILIADERTGTGSAAPAVGNDFTSGMATGYIELYSDATEVLKNTRSCSRWRRTRRRERSTAPPPKCNRRRPTRPTGARSKERFRWPFCRLVIT